MSSQLHSGESDRRKQVKFRADEPLVEDFDDWVAQSDVYQNRTDALQAAMQQMMGESEDIQPPRQPPGESDLRTAYLTLVKHCNYQGIIRHRIALRRLNTKLGTGEEINEDHLSKLRQRGYIRQLTNAQSFRRSWVVRGVDADE
jgi:hypothetical protein